MMRFFLSNNVVLFILVVTTTIDASRIFYLPLLKLHSSQQQQQQQIEPTKSQDDLPKKPISDEFIPDSVIEQEEIEKRGDGFDWEELVDRETEKRRINLNEQLPSEQVNHDLFLEEPWLINNDVIQRFERLQSTAELHSLERKKHRNDTLFIVVIGICCAVGVVGLVAAAIFWYKVQKKAEAAADAEYPSYGVTGPNTSSGGGGKISPSSTMSDRKLAQSAQMFHYQQQRQQMMAQEKAHLDAKPVNSDDSDDEAPGGGDYTVYECPGLAPTGEMEVRNPLFSEPDSSLLSSPTTNPHFPQLSTASPPKEKSIP